MTESARINCTARYIRPGQRTQFEQSGISVKAWHPTNPGDEPSILLQRGRRQYLFNLDAAYQLVNEITDAAEKLEDRMNQ